MSTPSTALPKRPYFAKKSDWARSEADKLRRQASELRYTATSSTRAAARKFDAVRELEAQAARMDTLARRYEAKGN